LPHRHRAAGQSGIEKKANCSSLLNPPTKMSGGGAGRMGRNPQKRSGCTLATWRRGHDSPTKERPRTSPTPHLLPKQQHGKRQGKGHCRRPCAPRLHAMGAGLKLHKPPLYPPSLIGRGATRSPANRALEKSSPDYEDLHRA